MADRTWQQSLSNASSDASSVANNAISYWFFLKNFLMGLTGGAAWTLVWCCGKDPADGVQKESADGSTDYLGGATYTASRWVRAAEASNHSGFVLQSPVGFGGNGPYYLNASMNGSNAYTPMSVYFSKAAPTGGSVTARRVATDETTALLKQCVENAIGAWKFHGWASDLGEFVVCGSKDTTGYMWGATWALSPASPVAALQYRCFGGANYGAASPGCFTSSNFGPVASWAGRVENNTGAGALGPMYLFDSGSSGASLDQLPVGGDILTSPLLPTAKIPIWCSTASHLGIYGILPDMAWGPKAMQPCGTPSTGAPYTSVLLGSINFPITAIPSM